MMSKSGTDRSAVATAVAPSRILRSSAARATTRFVAEILNPAIALLAGSRWLPLFGVLIHRGRRTGREHRTPVVMLRFRDGLVIPMTFGDHANWYRNVVAEGACSVVWRGSEQRLTSPVVIQAADVRADVPFAVRLLLSIAGIGHFLHLQTAPRETSGGARLDGAPPRA